MSYGSFEVVLFFVCVVMQLDQSNVYFFRAAQWLYSVHTKQDLMATDSSIQVDRSLIQASPFPETQIITRRLY